MSIGWRCDAPPRRGEIEIEWNLSRPCVNKYRSWRSFNELNEFFHFQDNLPLFSDLFPVDVRPTNKPSRSSCFAGNSCLETREATVVCYQQWKAFPKWYPSRGNEWCAGIATCIWVICDKCWITRKSCILQHIGNLVDRSSFPLVDGAS